MKQFCSKCGIVLRGRCAVSVMTLLCDECYYKEQQRSKVINMFGEDKK